MESTDAPLSSFALVEIMGHTRRAGAVSEVTFCGAPMLRIEHTSAVGADGSRVSVMYSPAALFSVTPCTFEAAVAANRWAWPDPADRVGELVAGVECSCEWMVRDDGVRLIFESDPDCEQHGAET